MKAQANSPIEIVYFGNDWFAENRTSSHHLARRLADRYPLLYVEAPGLRAPKATGRDARKLLRKISKSVALPQQIGPKMWHMTLPQIPFRRAPGIQTMNFLFSAWRVRAAIKHVGFRQPVLWFTVPHPGTLVGHLGERSAVYYCIDNYAALPDVDAVQVQRMDDELSKRADLVYVCSPALAEKKRSLNVSAVLAPHGVEVDHFRRSYEDHLPVPERARGLDKPVIGMFGLVDSRIDFDMLRFIAKARPSWTFLFVGRSSGHEHEFAGFDNVILTGPVPYADLPNWAQVFDVGIMPYRPSPLITNSNPLKLREYLAAGIPVVSVPVPTLEPYKDHVLVAETPQDFLDAIERSLNENGPERARARIAAVEPHSWDARVADVVAVLERHLEKPGPRVGVAASAAAL